MRGKPLDESLLLGQHGLLARIGRLAVGFPDRPLALVEVVVARIHGDLTAVDLGNLRRHAIHELAVVRRQQQRPRQRLEERLEPDDRLDVEVVGRLVHEQHVGPAEQHASHGHAHLPAAGQRADVALDPLVVEAETVQHLAGLCFEAIAAEVLVLLLHFAKAREDPVHVVGLRRVGHRGLQRLELMMQIAESPAAGNGFVQHRAAGHFIDVLAEVANRQLARNGDVAFVHALFADDHPEQGRLAGAIRTNESDLLAGVQLKRCVDEQNLTTVLLADLRKGNHRYNSPRPTRTARPPTFTEVMAADPPSIETCRTLGRFMTHALHE